MPIYTNVFWGACTLPCTWREALNTTDKRQAKKLEKNRIAEIKQGKNASKTGREFARKPFHEAVKVYLEEREPHVPERTMQFETERLGPLVKHFGEKPLLQFKAEDVSIYQITRLDAGVSGRTVNMETGVLRRMLKRAKVWNALSEDVKALPEQQGAVAKVLPARPEAQPVRKRREQAGMDGGALCGRARRFDHLSRRRDQEPPLAGRGSVRTSRDDPTKQGRRRPSDELVRETARRVGREAAQQALDS